MSRDKWLTAGAQPAKADGDKENRALPAGAGELAKYRLNSAVERAVSGVAQLIQTVSGCSDTNATNARDAFARTMASFAVLGGLMGPIEGFWRSCETAQPASEDESGKRFRNFTAAQLEQGRSNVVEFMQQHRAFTPDGSAYSLYQRFKQVPLSERQETRILNCLAQLYENFVRYRTADGGVDLDQKGNWFHTLDEMDEVLCSAEAEGLDPGQTERALMAMFGDADKTKANFLVHNLDGATAARVVLTRELADDFTEQDIRGVEESAKEHQIGPPGFMAQIYAGAIRGQINAERSAEYLALQHRQMIGLLDEEGLERLDFLNRTKQSSEANRSSDGPFVTEEESKAIASIFEKLSNPLGVALDRTPTGGMAVVFTPLERQLFRMTGNEHWYVPHASTSWYCQSRLSVDADSKANYTRVGGFKKLLGLNGPETDVWFQFKTLGECLRSPLRSFEQAYEIMTPTAQQQSAARLADTQAAIERALKRTENWLRQQIRAHGWLREADKSEDEILANMPFWKSELAYPVRDAAVDHEWWRLHKLGPNARNFAEQQFYEVHRYDGLTKRQIKYFEFAKQIREQMVDELGAEQRLDGALPRNLRPVMRKAT